jgi:hypothetical protein
VVAVEVRERRNWVVWFAYLSAVWCGAKRAWTWHARPSEAEERATDASWNLSVKIILVCKTFPSSSTNGALADVLHIMRVRDCWLV